MVLSVRGPATLEKKEPENTFIVDLEEAQGDFANKPNPTEADVVEHVVGKLEDISYRKER